MLDWVQRLLGTGNTVPGLTERQADALGRWFEKLDGLSPGLAERSLWFVLTGKGEGVLDELARTREAAAVLHLKPVSSLSGLDQRGVGRAVFGERLPEMAAYVRLGQVFASACRNSGWTPRLAKHGVPAWLELLLWEASSLHPSTFCAVGKEEVFLSHQAAEAALVVAGLPGDTVLRLVLTADPKDASWYNTDRLLQLMPGLPAAAELHPAVVREVLVRGSARIRTRAARVMRNARCSLALVLDEVVVLALDPAKTLREIAEAWLLDERDVAVPAIRRALGTGAGSGRGRAAMLLAKLGGPPERSFLQQRLQEEKSSAVREAIAAAIALLPDGPEAVPEQPAAKHEPGPLGVLGAEARTLLLALFAAWEKQAAEAVKRGWFAPGYRSPPALTAEMADAWLLAMQKPDVARPADVDALSLAKEDVPEAERFLATPGMTLGNVVRFAGLMGLFEHGGDGHGLRTWWLLSRLLKAFQRASGAVFGLREAAVECAALGVAPERFGWQVLHEYGPFNPWSDDETWPYFVDRHEALDTALGLAPSPSERGIFDRLSRSKALAVLAAMPRVPERYLTMLWSVALGTVKAERPLARRSLDKLADSRQRVLTAVASRNQGEREAAVEWLAESGDAEAIPVLRTALAKEKQERLKAAMMSALEAVGASVDDLLDRRGLHEEAARGLAKGMPKELDWFSFDGIPAVHWSDGELVDPAIITWWLVQNRKLGKPEPGPLLRRYAQGMMVDEALALGRYILEAWIAYDVAPYPEAEARARARAAVQSWVATIGPLTPEQEQAFVQRALVEPKGSAIAYKGMLAVAGALVGDLATPLVAEYLKSWYGLRSAQCKALLQMLAWVEGQGAVQLLLATATRFRTAGIRQTAEICVRELAERRGWTLDELADRTVPSADLDGEGVVHLSYGPRAFRARLSDALKLVVEDETGKALSTLPEPRQSDDAGAAADARQQLVACRKQVQAIVKQQTVRLYEAMCAERSWSVDDFRAYLLGHPILARLCQRVLWLAQAGESAVGFRPLADGTLTGAEDEAVELAVAARVRVLHPLLVSADLVAAWAKHLGDYEVEPLFEQLGRTPYRLPSELRTATCISDFRGHVLEAFKLRGQAIKLGYQRGPNDDGAWFSTYRRLLPGLGLEVVIQFTGNQLPEENRTVALETLAFWRTGPAGQALPLADVPAVLLSECYNDLQAIAAQGSGFDPNWESKTEG